MPILYPLLNGNRFDFSSAIINLNTRNYTGIKALNYNQGLDPGEMRGNRASVSGRTRGKYAAEADMEMYLSEYQVFITDLAAQGDGRGFMEVPFQIVASYSELDLDLVTDYLVGCRIKKATKSFQEGSDALSVKIDLHVMEIRDSGLSAIDPAQFYRTT